MTLPDLNLNFFDLHLCLRTDSEPLRTAVARLYRRFQTGPGHAPQTEMIALTGQPRPTLLVNGQSWPVDRTASLTPQVIMSIYTLIATQVRTHLLFHAGAVSHRGHGLILAGPSGLGKTTLVLELVRRGFKFLSDETAALSRTDRLLHPFPRGLGCTPVTLTLTGFCETRASHPRARSGKQVKDIAEFGPDSLGPAVPVSHVFLLQRHPENYSRSRFHQQTAFVPVRAATAVTNLLTQFQGGYNAAIFKEDLEGQAGRLFVELAAILAQVKYYHLYAGPLSKTVDLLCDIVDYSPHRSGLRQ
jgi:hypothetical protein